MQPSTSPLRRDCSECCIVQTSFLSQNSFDLYSALGSNNWVRTGKEKETTELVKKSQSLIDSILRLFKFTNIYYEVLWFPIMTSDDGIAIGKVPYLRGNGAGQNRGWCWRDGRHWRPWNQSNNGMMYKYACRLVYTPGYQGQHCSVPIISGSCLSNPIPTHCLLLKKKEKQSNCLSEMNGDNSLAYAFTFIDEHWATLHWRDIDDDSVALGLSLSEIS